MTHINTYVPVGDAWSEAGGHGMNNNMITYDVVSHTVRIPKYDGHQVGCLAQAEELAHFA